MNWLEHLLFRPRVFFWGPTTFLLFSKTFQEDHPSLPSATPSNIPSCNVHARIPQEKRLGSFFVIELVNSLGGLKWAPFQCPRAFRIAHIDRPILILFFFFFFDLHGVSGPACAHHDYSPRPTGHPASPEAGKAPRGWQACT